MEKPQHKVSLNKVLKVSLGFVAISILVTTLICYETFGASSSFTPRDIYLDDVPSTTSYVMDTDGTYYWATRDDGYIAYNGTDATTIVQSLVDLTNAGTVFFKEGTYSISTITLSQKIEFDGEGQLTTILQSSTDADTIIINSNYCALKNLALQNIATTFNHSLILITDETSQVSSTHLENLVLTRGMSYETGGNGIEFYSSGSGITGITTKNVFITSRLYRGVFLNQSGTGWINGNVFRDIRIYAVPYGVYMYQGGTGALRYNRFEVDYQANTSYVHTAFTLTDDFNTVINCFSYDIPDANYGLNITSGTVNKIANSHFSGKISDSGTLTEYTNVVQTIGGATKYSVISGQTTILNATNSTTVSHTLIKAPLFVEVCGEHNETAQAYSDSTTWSSTQFTISVPSNVTSDRYVRYRAYISQTN